MLAKLWVSFGPKERIREKVKITGRGIILVKKLRWRSFLPILPKP